MGPDLGTHWEDGLKGSEVRAEACPGGEDWRLGGRQPGQNETADGPGGRDLKLLSHRGSHPSGTSHSFFTAWWPESPKEDSGNWQAL